MVLQLAEHRDLLRYLDELIQLGLEGSRYVSKVHKWVGVSNHLFSEIGRLIGFYRYAGLQRDSSICTHTVSFTVIFVVFVKCDIYASLN